MTVESKISIIVPAHNLDSQLYRCLQSISQHWKKVLEVILVLDGVALKDDQFSDLVIPNLIVETLEENKGPAFARNHGATIARGDVLFFIDSDVMLLSDTIDRVREHFKNADSAHALIGSYDAHPAENTLVSKYRNLLHHYTHQKSNTRASTFWGACGAIRKEVFCSQGGFDISFSKASIEDIELGYRLTDLGYQINLDKTLQVKHLKKWTLKKTLYTDVQLRARPWTSLLHDRKKLKLNDLNMNYGERVATMLLLIGIIGLVSTAFWSFGILMAAIAFLFLISLKRKTYLFFASHFRWSSLPLVVLLHWLYLISALMGFVLGTWDYVLKPKLQVSSESFTNPEPH